MAILHDTMQSIVNVLKTACELLDKVSKPNPKHVKGPSQYEILKVRNKVIILIQIISLFLYLGDRILNSTSVQGDLIRWCMSIMIILVLLLSCRYHHEIFNVFYTCMCLTYGPFIMNLGGESIHKAWMSALHLPMFAYLFTGSFGHFLVQITIQYYYVNNLYIGIMEKAAIEMSPETFVSALSHSTNRNLSYAVAFGVLMNFILNKSFQRVICLEKRKTEFEAQKVFLLSFSHELRNLINSLTGNIKLASLVENISPRVKELLTNAEVCGEVLLHLVNNILDTGKVEIGELEVNPAPTRIYDTLAKTWGVCAELIKKQNIHGKMKIQKNIPKTLNIDHFRLTQMLLNLVSNSLKFTDHGSIEVSVSWIAAADQPLEKCFQPYPFNEDDEQDEGLFEKQKSFSSLDDNILALNTSSNRVHTNHFKQSSGIRNTKRGVLKVVVSDTGCGMDEEETTRLFKRFSQVSTDPGKRRLGTGLGLFITKQLCEKMGGEIKVFSKKNKGTSFIICIPVDVIPPEDIPESLWDLDLLRNFVMNQKLKAMLVDDISFNHTIMKTFFEKLGVEVVEIAYNGLEACKKYKEIMERGDKIDIVTMDLDMPIMDGKEATRKIREFELYRNLPPCFLTVISGNCSESEIEECLDRGGRIKADSFVKKPAALDELLRIIGHHFVRMQREKHSTLERNYL